MTHPKPQGRRSIVAREETPVDGPTRIRMVNENECALGWLVRRKDAAGQPLVSQQQFAAAEKLRMDYELGHIAPRITADWEARIRSGRGNGPDSLELTERTIAARQRYHLALRGVGPELGGILIEICCMAYGLEQAERRLELPARSGKAVLLLALTRLARHYGMLKSPDASRPIRQGAREDYRPEIMPAPPKPPAHRI